MLSASVFGGLARKHALRADLKKLGYSNELIPGWVAAGAELPAEGAGDSSLQKPKPAGVPVRVVRARKKESTEHSTANRAEHVDTR